MTQRNDGGPAFPMPIAGCNDGGIYDTMQVTGGELGGMTLRDYFAAAALQGMLVNGLYSFGGAAKDAYAFADAMLEARDE